MSQELLLLGAGLLGGAVNTLAGGGSFITFPALLAAGLPPVVANASNTLASTAGYVSGAWSLRHALSDSPKHLLGMAAIAAGCGGVGAWLLTQTSNTSFQSVIPWLLLFATVLFIGGAQLNAVLMRWSNQYQRHVVRRAGFLVVFVAVGVYGGFFNAGLGILLLSYVSLAGYTAVHEMNALKLLFSATISVSAIGFFLANDLIDWPGTLVLMAGTLIGGGVAGKLSQHLPTKWVRRTIICVSCAITAYFFAQPV